MSEGFGALGFNAEDMGKKIAGGGEGAREALGQVLDKLRGVTDEQERATLATALFGTQAEDLGDALYAMDLDTAIQSMNDYEGAAWRAINVMGGNASTSVEGAMRSIELAGDGMKAALAQAFGPYIKDFADNISNNRAGVIQFFIDIGNTVFEAGKSVLGFVEGGLRGLAEFAVSASETGASFLDMGANILSVGEAIPVFGDLLGLATGGAADKMRDMADKTRTGGEGISNMLEGAADGIHDTLIPALGQAQDRFNEFAGDMKLSAAFNDESAKVNKAIADIGVGADGAAIKIENWTGSIDRNNEAQVQMENGLKGMSDQFVNQIKTGMEAGNTVEALTGQYNENRNALIEQLMATGMSNKAAVDYLNVLGLTPEFVDTKILQSGMPEAKYELDVLKDKVIDVPDSKTIHTQALTQDSMDQLKALGLKVETLPDGTVNVTAETADAEARMQEWLSRQRTLRISAVITERRVAAGVDPTFIGPSLADNGLADGAIRTRADGMIDTAHIQQGSGQGIYTKSPLGPVQYAEGETQWEAYIPGAPSKRKRSEAILQDVARRFGFGLIKPDAIKMANGGVVESFTGIASQHAPGLQLTSSYRDTNDYHGQGKAVDYSNGSGNTDEQLAWANYLADNYQSQLAELIYSDPRFTRNIKDGKIVDPSFYGAATMQQHENHVHAASKEPLGAPSGAGKDAAPAAPDTRTEREKIADQVIAEGKRRGISDKGIKAAVMTALAETDLQNLDYGMDGDNAGIMQQRDNGGWGTLEDRKDPTRAAGMFYDKLDDFDYNSMSEAEAAQKVQQSGTADGSNYAVKAAEADEIIAASNARGNGSQMTVGTTDSGAALATDGQRVFVTNWPGTSSSSYSAPEPAPATAPAGGTSDAAGKDPNLIWSGGFKVFENGGMNLPDQAGLYSDGADLIRFAEKGTGGESYIPHAPSKRNRSVAITRETARRFGYELVPMADGGLTGFGGYVGEKPGLKVPTTANGRRAAAYNAAAFGVGAAFALASGFDADGKFTGQFDTGANSSSQLEKGFENATKEIQPVLEQILLAIKNREPIRAEVNVDRDSGMANINILKGGI